MSTPLCFISSSLTKNIFPQVPGHFTGIPGSDGVEGRPSGRVTTESTIEQNISSRLVSSVVEVVSGLS